MIALDNLLLFAGAALPMVLTPGPSMIHLDRAAGLAACFGRLRGWLLAPRYLMGLVPAGLALRPALEERKGA